MSPSEEEQCLSMSGVQTKLHLHQAASHPKTIGTMIPPINRSNKHKPERVMYLANSCYLFVTLAVFIFFTALLIFLRPSPPTPTPPEKDKHKHIPQTITCGATRAEAIANGCRLDVMGNAWLPVPCFNSTAASAAFDRTTFLSKVLGKGIFDWYIDSNHTQSVSLEKLSELDSLRAHTWQVYHVAHCLYGWQTMVRAVARVLSGERDVYIHSRLLDEDHVQHCARIIAGNGGEEGILRSPVYAAVEVRFGLGTCINLSGERSSSPESPIVQ